MTNHIHRGCHRFLFYIFGSLIPVIINGYLKQPSLPKNYSSLSALDKQTALWKLIQSTEGTQSRYPTIALANLLVEDLNATVKHFGDDLPYRKFHTKRIHSVGATATTKLVITNPKHPYTGLFQTGSNYGIVRLSLASSYSLGAAIPGIGVKFLRSQKPSANFVAMFTLAGQGKDGNFFKNNFSNHIPELGPNPGFFSEQVLKNFRRTSSEPFKVGLSDIARFYENGAPITEQSLANFPYKLILVPNPSLTSSFSGIKNANQLKVALTNLIPSNTSLYDMYAIDSPTNETPILIGQLVTSSKMIYSRLGDEFLFFRHQPMEEDLKLRPNWPKQNKSSRSKYLRRSRQLEPFHEELKDNKQLLSIHSNVSTIVENMMYPCAFAQQYDDAKE